MCTITTGILVLGTDYTLSTGLKQEPIRLTRLYRFEESIGSAERVVEMAKRDLEVKGA